MPGSYLIDARRRLVFSQGWGVLTDDEIVAHVRALREDARFQPAFQQVIDFRRLSEIKLSTTGIRAVAQRNPFSVDARRALVVASDEAFGLARMYAAFTDTPDPIRIYRALGPALEWVGLDAAMEWPADPPDAMFDFSLNLR
jgi:hypothetical protein